MAAEKAFMGEEVNWKKLLLLLQQRIWIIAMLGVAGAVIGSSLYLLIAVVFAGPTQYELEGGFYIQFADGVLDAHDYYNAYTWNSVVHQDKILDATMKALEEAGVVLGREYVSNSMQADILSDVRYLTLKVTCDTPEYATKIFDACETAIIQFGLDMDEFDAISVTHQQQPHAMLLPDMTWRAGLIGITIGLILAFFGLMLSYVADDSVFLQEELQDRYDLFAFGVLGKTSKKETAADKEWNEYCQKECRMNLEYRLKGTDKVAFIPVVDFVKNGQQNDTISVLSDARQIQIESYSMPQNNEEFEQLRTCKGVILGVPYGRKNGKLISKYMDILQKQDCAVLGAILIDADMRFQRRYYQDITKR